MHRISQAMNTYPAALTAVKERGFSITFRYDDETETGKWLASNGEFEVIADDPLALGGLVLLALEVGDAWQSTPRSEYDQYL